MGWGGFWRVLADGAAFATFGYWAAPFMLAAAGWVALATSDALLRRWLLGLAMCGVGTLVSAAFVQVAPSSYLEWLLRAPILALSIAFAIHLLLLIPDGGSRSARLAWAGANLTFIVRADLFLSGYI